MLSRHPRLIAVALVAAVLLGGLWLLQAARAQNERPSAKAPLLFNITSGKDSAHAVSMALGLASAAAREGHEVVVFLNVNGVQLASKDLSGDARAADFPPIKALLAQVMANGGKVVVCEHCAHVAGMDKNTLVSGATLTDQAALLAQLKPGMVGLSY